ncbi:uncharacterized protein LOC129604181 isoform X2 [Betta splendens]|uniref:Uncharacterized protein LOC129604181 isoform X2 n=1 Tax=Betta splendens TaxID=158456 RepID=A0A9W2XU92_BETSP|nr:uncharacterized protein LOC129604181 isoform X2 [Betta splendens]
MKFLLLVVILDCDSFRFSAGSGASSELSVCANGWIEFSCSYPNASITRYQSVEVFIPSGRQTVRIPESDRWDRTGNVLLYHNTTHRTLRVTVKELDTVRMMDSTSVDFIQDLAQNMKSSTWTWFLVRSASSGICKLERSVLFCWLNRTDWRICVFSSDADHCWNISRTVNTAGEIKLTCQNRRDKLPVLFFCKETDLICEEILSTSGSSKGRFTMGVTSHNFSLSISDVSSEDNGVYWCGVKSTDGRYRAFNAKIQLEVKGSLSSTTSTPWTGASPSSGSAAPEADGDCRTTVASAVCVCVMGLVLIVVVFYRCKKLLYTETHTRIHNSCAGAHEHTA